MESFSVGLLWLMVTGMLRTLAAVFSWLLWLLWPHWLVLCVLACLAVNPQPAHAGWGSWLWGSSNTKQLERSAEVAQQAAQAASEAAKAQARQAAAQASQNARLADALSQLSQERQNLANHLRALSDTSMRDSRIAAVLNASGPVLVCVAVLLLAGLSVWMVTRAGHIPEAELGDAVDLLVTEMAFQHPPAGYFTGGRLGGPAGEAHASLPRISLLPGKGSAAGKKHGQGQSQGGGHPHAHENPYRELEEHGLAETAHDDDEPVPF